MKYEKFSAKIEEIFGKKILPERVAVAVSGGADSLALTLLLQEFCREKKIKLFAVTVDHKMREGSSDEAESLGKILARKNEATHIFHSWQNFQRWIGIWEKSGIFLEN